MFTIERKPKKKFFFCKQIISDESIFTPLPKSMRSVLFSLSFRFVSFCLSVGQCSRTRIYSYVAVRESNSDALIVYYILYYSMTCWSTVNTHEHQALMRFANTRCNFMAINTQYSKCNELQ